MLDRIPVELSIRIIEQAALDFRFSAEHRPSVVHLASTSHTVYAIVAPVLYHTLIVNRMNWDKIRRFMTEQSAGSAAARVCSYVRVLVHSPDVPYAIYAKLFTSLESLYVMGSMALTFLAQIGSLRLTDVPLRRLTVLSNIFAGGVMRLPTHALARLTHICGLLPLFNSTEWDRMHANPVAWTHDNLDALPELTHLGLVLINVQPREISHIIVDLFDMRDLLIVVRTALAHREVMLQRVLLQVGCRYIDRRRRDIEHVIQQINDSRLSVWWDDRETSDWGQWGALRDADVMAGRDIWTEARAVSSTISGH